MSRRALHLPWQSFFQREGGSDPGSRPEFRTVLIAAAALFLLYCALGFAYGRLAPSIAWVPDAYFGADIDRHEAWVNDLRFWRRGALHPASLALFKAYAIVLRGVGAIPGTLPFVVYALPGILVVSLALALAAYDSSPARLVGRLLAALLVGPTPMLAPIPESHALGGAALLLQALLLLEAQRAEQRGDESKAIARPAALAVASGGLAIGFTLVNVLPAAAMLVLLPRSTRATFWRIALVAAAVTGVALLGVASFKLRTEASYDPWFETSFMIRPTLAALERSFATVVVAQFGTPATMLVSVPSIGNVVLLRPRLSDLQVVAAALWLLGIAAWLRDASSVERRFAVACGVALSSVVAFHTTYANQEAFMFSPHAWPYILLPGLAAGLDARRGAPVLLVRAALLLCLVQVASAFPDFLAALKAM